MIISTDDVGTVRQTLIGDCMIADSHLVKHINGRIFVRYLYDDLLQKLAKDMHENVRNHFDNVVVVEGAEGSGKSNLAFWIAKYYDPEFDISTGYVYDFDDLKDKLSQGNDRYSVFWMDETSNMANNRDWQSNDNKNLVNLLEMMRSRGWTLIMCIPKKERLDCYIRENRIRYLVSCYPAEFDLNGKRDRGYFELEKKSTTGMMKHIGYGIYSVIPEENKKLYEKIKLQSQEKKIQEIIGSEKAGGKYKKMYEEKCNIINDVMLRMYNSGIDSQHIMDLFGITDIHQFHNILSKTRRAKNE